jgi:hypothetical protein
MAVLLLRIGCHRRRYSSMVVAIMRHVLGLRHVVHVVFFMLNVVPVN